MNKKEIQANVHRLLASGTAKSEVFTQLSGQGVKDSKLAYFIASYADPNRCDKHDRKVNILITFMFIQAAIGLLVGFGVGAQIGPNAKWIFGALGALIPLLFVWGFYKHLAGAYNAYILLSILQLPKPFDGFASSPLATSIAFAVNIMLLAYAWYIREKLFPDFAFIAPRKIKGKYVFSD
ncbi:hypothetical protein [Azotobacter salinestris]|uniref:hypothetical protein n=1 Tax=Azotobacter salinestris TaxID=69964 RepID=UPI0032DFAB08